MSQALELQIKSLEERLSQLKAKLNASKQDDAEMPFNELRGILKGKANTSEERIEEILLGRRLE